MKFLDPYIEHKDTLSNFDVVENTHMSGVSSSDGLSFLSEICSSTITPPISAPLSLSLLESSFGSTETEPAGSSSNEKETTSEAPMHKKQKAGKKRNSSNEDDLTNYLVESMKKTDEYLNERKANCKEDDDCSHFGRFIASQLRKLTEYQQDVARRRINDYLWDIKWNNNGNDI